MTKGNKLALSEVKSLLDLTEVGGKIDAARAVEQLESTMAQLNTMGIAGDVERLELIMPKDVPFKNPNHGVKDGYLINTVTGETVMIKDIAGIKNLFIKVVRL